MANWDPNAANTLMAVCANTGVAGGALYNIIDAWANGLVHQQVRSWRVGVYFIIVSADQNQVFRVDVD